MALNYPDIDPVLIEIFGLPIRWYALAYIAGILLSWRMAVKLADQSAASHKKLVTRQQLDDFILWATLGIILGGRLGYIIFYKPYLLLDDPLQVPQVWQGGMSFHGGFLGVAVAAWLFTKSRKISLFALTDVLAVVAPIGLFFGRIANFINGELYGRPTGVSWGMIFPDGGPFVRHPSQLYQAALEGLVIFILMYTLSKKTKMLESPGVASGLFLILYGVARMIGELFREPDGHLGFIVEHVTMGQILSLPMIAAGGFLIYVVNRRRLKSGN